MDPKCLLPSSKKILSFFPVVSQLIHSTSSHTISGKSSLIFSHLHQGLPSGLSFFQVFPPKLCMCFIPPHTCHINNSCHRPWFYLTNQPTNKQTNQSTNSMEQAPSWEANKSSASHEIPCIVWNAKVYYHIHKTPPPNPVLSQISRVHKTPSHFLKIHFNISLLTPRSSLWSLSFRCPHQIPVCASHVSHTCHMSCPSLSSFDHQNNIWWGVQIIKLIIISPDSWFYQPKNISWVKMMKFLVMQISASLCYILSLWSKCLPQQTILEHHQCVFFP